MSKQSYQVSIACSDLRFTASATSTLLDAARAAGIALPSSCRNGTCRTCLSRLQSGDVGYRIEWPGLSRDEKRDGYMLPCVAYPLSDLVLEQPGARVDPSAHINSIGANAAPHVR